MTLLTKRSVSKVASLSRVEHDLRVLIRICRVVSEDLWRNHLDKFRFSSLLLIGKDFPEYYENLGFSRRESYKI